MATIPGSQRLLNISGNNIATAVSLEAGGTLLDGGGLSGSSNQVLISTGTGVDWVNSSSIIGGPYLPLSAGASYPLTGQLWFTGTTDANRKIFFTNAGTYAKGSMDAASYGFQVSGSEKLTILSSGNVGIGTTSPAAKLDVDGATILSGTLNVEGVSTLANVGYLGDGLGSVQYTLQSANNGFGTIDFGDVADANIGRLSYSHVDNSFLIRTNNATALTLDSSQDATFAGTVTAPTFIGDLNGTINTATTGATQTAGNNSTLIATTAYADAAAAAVPIGNYLPVANPTFTGVLTGPYADLEYIKLTAANPGILMKETDTTDKNWDIQVNSGNLLFYEVNDARSVFNQRVTFEAGGNVGIGTTTPDARLDVNGGLNSTHAIFSGQDGRGLKLSTENTLNNDDGVVYDAQTSTGKHLFKVSGAEKMRIDTSGNVGIGVTGPLDKLDVSNGNIRISQTGNVAAQLILNTYQSALGNATYKWFVEQTTSANSYSFQIGNGTTPYLHINSVLFGAAAGNVGIGNTSPNHKLDVTGDIYSSGQMLTKGAAMACFTVLGDLDTGLGNFNTLGRVSLVSNNKPSITVNDDKVAFDGYIATAVATTGSLNANQSQQALTSDTLAVLAVDPTGNIVRGSQEGTWTFTKAQLDALTTSTTSGTTLIAAPGANKAIIVEESNLMIKYSGTGTMSSNSFVIRQAHNGDATAEITRLPSGQINTIMSSAPANPSYGFYSRDLPLYNNDGRSFVTNKATFLSRINTNATPTNLVSISIKLKYRIFNATTF